jgi:hypothetical protein
MHTRLVPIPTAILLAVGAVVTVAAPASAQRRVPDLSGVWVMRDTTEWPSPARDSAAAADTTRDTTMIQYTKPLGGGGRMHVRLPAEPDPRSRAVQHFEMLRGIVRPVRAFTITQTGSSVTVAKEDGASVTVVPGGDKIIMAHHDTVRVEVRAKWDDGVLAIEYRPAGGGTLVERYYLSDSRQYVRLETKVDYPDYSRWYGQYWRSVMYRREGQGGP